MAWCNPEVKDVIRELLDPILPEGLPADWPTDRPLVEAGLDSVAVLQLVAAIEERFDFTLADTDLDISHFGTVDSLAALIDRRSR